MLKPQDILVTLKLVALVEAGGATISRMTYSDLSASLGLSASECHAAVQRSVQSTLLMTDPARPTSLEHLHVRTPAVEEVLCHGVRYFLPAKRGPLAKGIPTAESAPPLVDGLVASTDYPTVWEHPKGSVQGYALEPLYPSAPDAALADPILAEWLALCDALRTRIGRIAGLATNEVRSRLRRLHHAAAA